MRISFAVAAVAALVTEGAQATRLGSMSLTELQNLAQAKTLVDNEIQSLNKEKEPSFA